MKERRSSEADIWHLEGEDSTATERVRGVRSVVPSYKFTTSGRLYWPDRTGSGLCFESRQ